MESKAYVLYADGRSNEVSPANGTDFSLEEMQKIVGGNIEICECHDSSMILVINEEGKLEGLDFNYDATLKYKYAKVNGKLVDVIVGDVLYCPSEMVK